MKQATKQKIALTLAVAVKMGFALYVGGAFTNSESVRNVESADVGGSMAYEYDPLSVEQFAEWGKLSLERAKDISERMPYLLQKDAVESVGGFNPYTCKDCNIKSIEQLENSKLTDDQAWKWFRYRREEIGACFEEELFNIESKQCDLIEDLQGVAND